MLIIVGLGNPGERYAGTRHNIGFRAVERIADRHQFGPWRTKFQGRIAEGDLAGRKTLLLLPMTFMNLSGTAVAAAAGFHKVSVGDLVVVHDEIDLPPGKLRMKAGGGAGGHNGIRSVIAHLDDGFRRVRIGVGHPGRPEAVESYVLKDFAKADNDWIEPLLTAIADQAALLADGADASFANKVHLAIAPPKPPKDGEPPRGAPSGAGPGRG